jgi:hypothetical protein
MSQIKIGSRWTGTEGKIFRVIDTITIEDKNWVYYRLEKPQEHLPSEFSCYEESFTSRFRLLPE